MRRLLRAVLIASTTHVGAAATSASLRETLAQEHLVTTEQFDRSFAASRLTPGTNLIALFAALGGIVGGPLGAITTVVVGLLPAVIISIFVCAIYLQAGDSETLSRAVRSATAAAWAVLVWSAGRFLAAPARTHLTATAALALTVIALALVGVPIVLLLVLSAGAGAIALVPRTP